MLYATDESVNSLSETDSICANLNLNKVLTGENTKTTPLPEFEAHMSDPEFYICYIERLYQQSGYLFRNVF